MSDAFATPLEHLQALLELAQLMARRQVMRLRAARVLNEESWRGLAIADAQVDALLAHDPSAHTANAPDVADLSRRIARLRDDIFARAEGDESLPLVLLARLYGLSEFEQLALALALAPDVNADFQTVYAYAQNDVNKKHASVALALNMLCLDFADQVERRACFGPDAPLVLHRLVGLQGDGALLEKFIRVDERIAGFALGHNALDARLEGMAEARAWPDDAPSAEMNDARQKAITQILMDMPRAVVFAHGAGGAGKNAFVDGICAALKWPQVRLDARLALASAIGLQNALALARREADLRGAAIVVRGFEHALSDEAKVEERLFALERELGGHPRGVFILSQTAWQPARRWKDARWFDAPLTLPDYAERAALWRVALAEQGDVISSEELAALAGRYTLSKRQIADAALAAQDAALLRGEKHGHVTLKDLQMAAVAQSNQTLRKLAQKVEPKYGWDDIVLPPASLRQLREICGAVKNANTVRAVWGFERKLALGRGMNILFGGASGTGKTMAAQILARELGLALYKIDLSSLVSKYVGDTEKNLSRIFAEAQTSNAMLFFDEADALFGKRSEVKDAHDRYANIEVAYLLQKMEEYEGAVILATNFSQNLDEAFKRRMHYTLDFPFPDAERRAKIWRGVLPAQAPLAEDVDLDFLARQFELSGANIRNAALAGAYLAAEDGNAIRMGHLILGTARELQKLGKLPSRAEFGKYYEELRITNY